MDAWIVWLGFGRGFVSGGGGGVGTFLFEQVGGWVGGWVGWWFPYLVDGHVLDVGVEAEVAVLGEKVGQRVVHCFGVRGAVEGDGWVGDGEVEESEAVLMRCWTLWVGGWVGGKRKYGVLGEKVGQRVVHCFGVGGAGWGEWVGGWVGRDV